MQINFYFDTYGDIFFDAFLFFFDPSPTGCAIVILLPWCDFPLPDVTSPYRRRAMGMMWLFPPDVT